jgi:hypothetical protein
VNEIGEVVSAAYNLPYFVLPYENKEPPPQVQRSKIIGNMPPNPPKPPPSLQPHPLFPPEPPNRPPSPPHNNSKIKIMKIGLMPFSLPLLLQQDAVDKSLITKPPIIYYSIAYEVSRYIYIYQCDLVTGRAGHAWVPDASEETHYLNMMI